MSKLYTVKQMAEILNEEFGENPADYEFTEERVRARLRSARARGAITPKHMGFDRRTNYYSEEDFAKLKAVWVGPERAEFTDYPEDLEIIDAEKEEVIIRPAKEGDVDGILALLPPVDDETGNSIRMYVSKVLKSRNHTNFVSTLNDEEITGWAQAEISAARSLIRNEVTGTISIFTPSTRKERPIIVRSLFHRAYSWLHQYSARKVIVEVPAFMADLEELFENTLLLHPEDQILFFTNEQD